LIEASLLSKSVSVPEKIVKRKIIVYKSRIDQKAVRVIAEKIKTQLFRKLVFIKPKPEEVQVISIDKYFEPYVVVDGEYSIDYSKNWSHNIQVDETMMDFTLFGEKIKPASLKDHLGTPCKIVTVTGVGRYKFKAKSRLIFDKRWREVGLEQLPFVPFEEQPEKVLSMIEQKVGNNMLTVGKEVELLKSKIVRRPAEILSVHDELFKVSERAVIYKPMYNVTVQNIKTKKAITLIIDAITGKTASVTKQAEVPAKKKKTAKESASSSAKTAVEKVSPVKKTGNKTESKAAL
jgi:hypothetical protein